VWLQVLRFTWCWYSAHFLVDHASTDHRHTRLQ
jgi:hypothetical protein